MNPPSLATILARLDAESKRTVRIETRLVRLMEHFGLNSRGAPDPQPLTESTRHAQRQDIQ